MRSPRVLQPRRTLAVALLACATAACLTVGAGAREGSGRGMIVYWSQVPWPSIWAIRPDGSDRRRILRNRQNAKRPALSPDRTWVAFDGAPPGKPPLSDFDIQLARLDGSDVMPLTNAPEWDTDAKWSPDGNWLSFTRSPPSPTDCSDSVIWMMRRDGSEARPVVAGCGARWSPDGARLVYSSPTTGDLFVVAVNGGNPRRLLATRAHEFPAAWSPDGTRILFTRSYDRVGRIADVMVVNADGTRVRKLADGWAGSWSPNGSRIVYVGSPSALFVMRGDGSRARRISRWWARDPSWR